MGRLARELERVAHNLYSRGELPLPALNPAPSFLWPAEAFLHREALSWMTAQGNCGLLNPEIVAGKTVLCFVETAANTTIVRRLLPAAARVDFVLQSEHAMISKFIAEQPASGVECAQRLFDNILAIGDPEERDCAERNFANFESFAAGLQSLFESDMRLHKYRPHSSFLAAYVEPRTYFWCFIAPKAVEKLIAARRPDLIIVICRNAAYFGSMLPCMRHYAGDIPVLIGYSNRLASKRRGACGRIGKIVERQQRQSSGSSVRWAAPIEHDEAPREFASALRRLEHDAEDALARDWFELHDKQGYGAITTVAADSVGYNYAFRRRLLTRLAETFDLTIFMLKIPLRQQKALRNELSAAGQERRRTNLVAYSPAAKEFRSFLAGFLDRHRTLWQSKLLALAGGSWVVPQFEAAIFDHMIESVASACEYIAFLQATFRVSPPAFALAITGETPWAAILLTAARQAGIPTFDMQVVAMSDEPRNRVSLLPKADHFFAMDAQSAELLASWGWSADGLYPNGTVRFDQLQELELAERRQRTRARFANRGFRHLVLFASQLQSFQYCEDALTVIADFIAGRPDVFLLVKLHPREVDGNRAQYEAILTRAAPARNWRVISDISIDDALAASDLVIGIYSLALLEAACLRIPVIAANLSGKRLPEPTNFGDRDCIHGAGSAAELLQLMASLLDDASFRATSRASQEAYFRTHAYMVDRGALERIARSIEEAVEKRPISAQSLVAYRSCRRNERAEQQ